MKSGERGKNNKSGEKCNLDDKAENFKGNKSEKYLIEVKSCGEKGKNGGVLTVVKDVRC